jgi:acetyl-CoA carboxylase biotin carboxyl carrier protein
MPKITKDACGFDLDFLKEVKDLMAETDIEELEIEEGDKRYLRVSKRKETIQNSMPAVFPQPVPIQKEDSSVSVPEQKTVPVQVSDPFDDDNKYHRILSPVIGTFYCAPSPDSPPYIKLGDSVSSDTTVCIVEAMKVMNEIKADVNGKIVKILKTNASPVQSGEPMFIVEKN